MFSPPALQSPAEFQQRLRLAKEADQLVLVLCFAPWCAACRALHPKVQQLAERNPTVTFLEVGTAAPIGVLRMLSCSARSALAGGSVASQPLLQLLKRVCIVRVLTGGGGTLCPTGAPFGASLPQG